MHKKSAQNERFMINDDKSFYHGDNGDLGFCYSYRYRIQKFKMDKLIY